MVFVSADIKKCKENVISTWGRGGFHKFLVLGQLNGSLQTKKNHQNICALGCTITNLN